MKKFTTHVPRLGKRIIKSAIGVWLCYLIHKLRDGNGIVFYSQLAVLWCIQPYVADSLKNGIQRAIGTFLEDKNQNYFMNLVIDDVCVISCPDLDIDVENNIYRTLRKSPYRNFVRKDLSEDGDLLYFMCIGDQQKTDFIYQELINKSFSEEIKILYYSSTNYPGQMYLKIYDRRATKENMIAYLKEYTGIQKVLSFGSIEGKYDITVHPNEHDIVARTLEKVYEPYFFCE